MIIERSLHPGLLPVKAAKAQVCYPKTVLAPSYSLRINLTLFGISDITVGGGDADVAVHFENRLWAQLDSQPLHHLVKHMTYITHTSYPATGRGMTTYVGHPFPTMLADVHLLIKYLCFVAIWFWLLLNILSLPACSLCLRYNGLTKVCRFQDSMGFVSILRFNAACSALNVEVLKLELNNTP